MHLTEILADFVFNFKAHNSKHGDFQNIHYIQAHSSKNCDLPNMFPNYYWVSVAYPGILFWGGSLGVQQIQLRTERLGIWGQKPPSQGFWRQL